MLRRLDSGILVGTQHATSVHTSSATGIARNESTTGTQDFSALGESFGQTPLVVPIRGRLDSVKRLPRGDVYIGRGSRQRSLPKSRYCNTFKVSQVGRSLAISSFRQALLADPVLLNSLWTLSGTRLVCHCRATEDCHGDVLIEEFSHLLTIATSLVVFRLGMRSLVSWLGFGRSQKVTRDPVRTRAFLRSSLATVVMARL